MLCLVPEKINVGKEKKRKEAEIFESYLGYKEQ